MKIQLFAHSWLSDWNHGNAHFLRGIARALATMGHEVLLYEALDGPWGGWSLANLWRQEPLLAGGAIREFREVYPELEVRFYRGVATNDGGEARLQQALAAEVRDADLVIAHEWNPPVLLDALASLRKRFGFQLLFHDTHHRVVTEPEAIRRLPISSCDGVLVFGSALAGPYAALGARRILVWHEAADDTWFAPRIRERRREALWIGNWGDEERSTSLREFLLKPALALPKARFDAFGARFPAAARAELRAAGVHLRGYLPNLRAPEEYGGSLAALHVPRAPYLDQLEGIPTIRVFEALACGCALICSPWRDSERLFRAGEDFVIARAGRDLTDRIRELMRDPAQAEQIGARGRETVLARHTCRHRAQELLQWLERGAARAPSSAVAAASSAAMMEAAK